MRGFLNPVGMAGAILVVAGTGLSWSAANGAIPSGSGVQVVGGGVASTPGPTLNAVSSTALLVRVREGWSIQREVHSGQWRASDAQGVVDPVASTVMNNFGVAAVEPLLAQPVGRPLLATALGLDRDVVLRLSVPIDAPATALLLSSSSAFELAEPMATGVLCDAAVEGPTPNDPLFAQEYALLNHGQLIQGHPGTPGADVDAVSAWELARQERGVVVAVVDSGVHPHEDLPALLPGWNVALQTTFTGDEYSSHGTHIAGIIGARHNNGLGVAGVARHVQILPVKVTNLYGSTSADWVAQGIVWAADHGAHVLNVSIGFSTGNTALRGAVQYAVASGCLVVASAGNTPTVPIAFPARYPEVIAVGATENNDTIASFSSGGAELDLVAPGQDIISTWHQFFAPETYQFRTGTSQAAPVIAGVASMILSSNATLTAANARMILEKSADDLGAPGWDPVYGHGRVNAARAVQMALAWGKPTTVSGAALTNCRPDLNRDGAVDSEDYFLYLALFVGGDLRADFAVPWGLITSEDFFAYNSAFDVGCQP